MLPSTLLCFLSPLLVSLVAHAEQTFFPAGIPLAVRSPYLNVWLNSTAGASNIANEWPQPWSQQSLLGWDGRIRVDGKSYRWIGFDGASDAANLTSFQITATRSIFVMEAGPMNLTVTFLSPIEPTDWVKQSLSFSYMSVEAQALDGASHSVQMYSDISAEFVSGNRGDLVKWSQKSTGKSVYLEVEPQDPQTNVEIAQQAQDGKSYYAMATRSGLSWQIDESVSARDRFVNSGSLTNTNNETFGPIDNPFYVFAIAVDLGTIQSTSSPVTWALGYIRDPEVTFTTSSGAIESRRPYWTTQYSDIDSAIDAFTGDFSAAYDRAVALDQRIQSDAGQTSSEYADLVSLAARQSLAALDITVLSNDDGSVDATDVKIFMKDIGTSQRINPVERMYTAFPAYLYLNASFGGGLLAPLLEAQDTLVDQQYAAQDLGINYPNATGTRGAHNQGIEQSGNMLIMMYAHARLSGDGSLLAQHYDTAKRWANYLVNNTLTPDNQASADGDTTANNTNLALKGIVGVKAMAEISRAVGQDSDAKDYDSHAKSLIQSWESLAQATDGHLLGIYNEQSSWALLYNIYADVLLGTQLVTKSVLDSQTSYYSTLLGSTSETYGLPINSNDTDTASTAWTLFTAATATDSNVQLPLIHAVWNRMSTNTSQGGFPELYSAKTGSMLDGQAGPGVGGVFSILALSVSNRTIITPEFGSSSDDGSSKSNIGAIVGGVIGGVAIIAIAAILLIWRKRRQRHAADQEKVDLFGDHNPPAVSSHYLAIPTQPHGGMEEDVPAVITPFRASEQSAPAASPDPQLPHNQGIAPFAFAITAQEQPPALLYARNTDPAVTDTSGAPYAPGPERSARSKAREAALESRHRYDSSISTAVSNPTSSSSAAPGIPTTSPTKGPQSPRAASGSPVAAATSPASQTDVVGLRQELENLRRAMEGMRQQGELEPPPQYTA